MYFELSGHGPECEGMQKRGKKALELVPEIIARI